MSNKRVTEVTRAIRIEKEALPDWVVAKLDELAGGNSGDEIQPLNFSELSSEAKEYIESLVKRVAEDGETISGIEVLEGEEAEAHARGLLSEAKKEKVEKVISDLIDTLLGEEEAKTRTAKILVNKTDDMIEGLDAMTDGLGGGISMLLGKDEGRKVMAKLYNAAAKYCREYNKKYKLDS